MINKKKIHISQKNKINLSATDHINLLHEHDIDLLNGIIYIGSDGTNAEEEELGITHQLADRFIKNAFLLKHYGHKDITVIINSPGGDTQQGMAIYDMIQSFPGKKKIIVHGICYSMAAIILQAGTERVISRNSLVMIHDGQRTYRYLRTEDFRQQSKIDDIVDQKCYEILWNALKKKKKNLTLSAVKKIMKSDTYYTAEEAIEIGLADYII